MMRLGEFYLNYAEAMYHYYGNANTKGEFTLSANDAVNAILDRADVGRPHWTTSTADWLQRYERERMVEMAFEDQRFWDIRRWKKGESQNAVKTISLTKDAEGQLLLHRGSLSRGWNNKFYFFPIPFDEISKNPNLVQNPGWEK